MARPSKFAHVVYSTRRFEEMIDWYENVFEAKVVYQNPVFAFLTYDDEHHRFAFANLSALMPESVASETRDNAGVNHVAYTYANLGDLLVTYERLKQMGVNPTGAFIMESHYRFTTRIRTAIGWNFKWTAVQSMRPTPICTVTPSPRIRQG